MTMTRHTTGPWEVNGQTIVGNAELQQGLVPICELLTEDFQEDLPWRANARLIAAAPALLEACNTALIELRNLADEIKPKSNGCICRAAEALKAAIAKATPTETETSTSTVQGGGQ